MPARARVAVIDPLPLFQLGIRARWPPAGTSLPRRQTSSNGSDPGQGQVVLVSISRPYAWEILRELSRFAPGPAVVVLLDPLTDEAVTRAIHLGASSVVTRSIEPDDLVVTIDMAMAGNSVVPTSSLAVISKLSRPTTTSTTGRTISSRHLEWLTILAAGGTVAELARRTGYSERTMFRLLSALYEKMGVRNRTEALMQAHEQGWLTSTGQQRADS